MSGIGLCGQGRRMTTILARLLATAAVVATGVNAGQSRTSSSGKGLARSVGDWDQKTCNAEYSQALTDVSSSGLSTACQSYLTTELEAFITASGNRESFKAPANAFRNIGTACVTSDVESLPSKFLSFISSLASKECDGFQLTQAPTTTPTSSSTTAQTTTPTKTAVETTPAPVKTTTPAPEAPALTPAPAPAPAAAPPTLTPAPAAQDLTFSNDEPERLGTTNSGESVYKLDIENFGEQLPSQIFVSITRSDASESMTINGTKYTLEKAVISKIQNSLKLNQDKNISGRRLPDISYSISLKNPLPETQTQRRQAELQRSLNSKFIIKQEEEPSGNWEITQLTDDIQQESAEVPSANQDQVKVNAEKKDVIEETNKIIKSVPMNVGVAAGVSIVPNGLYLLYSAYKKYKTLPSGGFLPLKNEFNYAVLGGFLSFLSSIAAWTTTKTEVSNSINTAIKEMATSNSGTDDLNLEPNNNQMAFALLGLLGPIILAKCLATSNISEEDDAISTSNPDGFVPSISAGGSNNHQPKKMEIESSTSNQNDHSSNFDDEVELIV